VNTEQQKACARFCEVSAFGQIASVGYASFQSGDWLFFGLSFAVFIFLLIVEYAILALEIEEIQK